MMTQTIGNSTISTGVTSICFSPSTSGGPRVSSPRMLARLGFQLKIPVRQDPEGGSKPKPKRKHSTQHRQLDRHGQRKTADEVDTLAGSDTLSNAFGSSTARDRGAGVPEP